MDGVVALLDAHHVLHLATAGPDGPHAAPVFFAHVGVDLTWISAPHVLHSVHLLADPRAAGSVGPSAPPLGLIEGLQLRGTAEVPADQAPWRAAWLARFPAAAAMVTPTHAFWVLRPDWVRRVHTDRGVNRNQTWRRCPEGWQAEPSPT